MHQRPNHGKALQRDCLSVVSLAEEIQRDPGLSGVSTTDRESKDRALRAIGNIREETGNVDKLHASREKTFLNSCTKRCGRALLHQHIVIVPCSYTLKRQQMIVVRGNNIRPLARFRYQEVGCSDSLRLMCLEQYTQPLTNKFLHLARGESQWPPIRTRHTPLKVGRR